MRRFVAVLTLVLVAGYVYLAMRLGSSLEARLALAAPFLFVWVVPMVYWSGGRQRVSAADDVVHGLGRPTLSGHTHAGQFFPWTLVIHLVHGPHAAGLSRRGRMWVYTSPGTGTWGPPVRLGTTPELTVLRLVRAAPA